jgi:hypothetical protein
MTEVRQNHYRTDFGNQPELFKTWITADEAE